MIGAYFTHVLTSNSDSVDLFFFLLLLSSENDCFFVCLFSQPAISFDRTASFRRLSIYATIDSYSALALAKTPSNPNPPIKCEVIKSAYNGMESRVQHPSPIPVARPDR